MGLVLQPPYATNAVVDGNTINGTLVKEDISSKLIGANVVSKSIACN